MCDSATKCYVFYGIILLVLPKKLTETSCVRFVDNGC